MDQQKAVKLPEYKDDNNGVVRPFTSAAFARTDLIKDGSNNDLWAN